MVVIDLDDVRRLGNEKADENIAFRRHLAAHHVREAAFQILATEIQREVDCTACANCCRHSIVSVNAAELETIAAHLSVSPETARAVYMEPDPEAPVLRRLRSTLDGCIFLDTENFCIIYEARPNTCRDFPHINVGHHSLGARPASQARWAALCPIIYNALETYKRITGFHKRSSQTRQLTSGITGE
ncbi:MAG: YkgJ family cysteine cluster protein [Bryobacteraceae bacterium]|nr:YkgJ family cysteine cluster protein [Bryobacteraceae bacterium]